MKKHPIAALTLALALTLGLSLPAQADGITFSDVPQDHWAVESVARMAQGGIMTGVGNNMFAPEQTLTCAEFITMIVRQFYPDKIPDMEGAWYAPYMAAAESTAILNGAEVSAEATIDRYNMAQVMYNVMQDQKMSTTPLSDTSKVADWSSVPTAYQDAVSVCYNMGMLSGVDGKGTFNGTGVMTRAQAAVVMDRLIGDEQVAPTPGEIPAGALVLNSSNTSLHDGEFLDDGTIKLECDGITSTGGYIEFTNTGYSTLTFTVAVNTWKHVITVGGVDSLITSDRRMMEEQDASSVETYTVDISGARRISMCVFSGRKCDAVVSNIYLT